MSRFATHYPVGRSSGVCAATGETLPPGTPCIATLSEREEDEAFDRADFSVEAWERGERPPGLFSWWRTTVAEPDARRKLLVDDEVLLDLFTRLADDDREQRRAFRFVLALILMRKKLLRFTGRDGEGEAECWLFRAKGADPESAPVEVANPHLGDDDVRELTAQLGEILQGDL